VDPSQVDYLLKRLLSAGPTELPVLREALEPHRSQLASKLWTELRKAKAGDPSLLASAGALALYDAENPRWADLGGKVAQALVIENSLVIGPWLENLRPVHGKLTTPLATIFRDKQLSETAHSLATDILAEYASDDPDLLAELLMVSDPKSYARLFPVVEWLGAKALPGFRAQIPPPLTHPNPPRLER